MALIPDIPPLTGAVDPLDAHLVKGDGTSTYRLKVAEKPSGRLMWEFWASNVYLMVSMEEYTLTDWREWKAATISDGARKTNGQKFDDLRLKWPDLAERIDAEIAAKDAP